ncbi:hypothetical protein [Bacillus bingmayongensis]|uniref:hypothetical protein n=1 Tax=Bacillus bingmayongensis TaxID=1150157 RepID=UPI0002F13BE0|nr:hypothetical protein [Bacillus bingmayongensis]MBY0595120.1 hypothetical protein [Bacillus bingmayongensis]
MLLDKNDITLEIKLKNQKPSEHSLEELLKKGIINLDLKPNERFNLALESELIIHNYPKKGEIHSSKVKKIKTKYKNLSGDIEYIKYSLEIYK